MTIVKRYITIQPLHKLNVEVKVKKEYIRILFSNGGTVNGGNATYITSDESIQKALEESSMFGKMYRLQAAQNDGTPEHTKKDEHPNDNEGQVPPSPMGEEGDGAGQNLKFANYNELRDFLVSEHGCAPAEVRSTEAALAKAAELKLNVTLEK